jgi:L-rhamnose isomerase
MQQKMSEQLKKMKDGLEKEGQKQAGQKKSGQGSVNEQIARMAAEQEAIRNEMQRYKESLEEQGLKDGGNAANAIREMEQNERDLINKQITQETIMRQQKIMTRLLESEKAEMEREKQEKRESREQKEQKYRNFNGDLKYNNLKTGGNEILEYKTAPLNLYYRNRVNSYMIKIGQ